MKDDFRKKTLECIEVCKKELKDRQEGIKGESSIGQIEKVILPELNAVISSLDNNQMPEEGERYLNSFANAFTVWGWDMQNPSELFILLTQLNDQYKELN